VGSDEPVAVDTRGDSVSDRQGTVGEAAVNQWALSSEHLQITRGREPSISYELLPMY